MRIATIAVVTVLVAALLPGVAAGATTDEDPGKTIFLAEKCDTCHSVSSARIESKAKPDSRLFAGDLAGGARVDPEGLAAYLRKEVPRNGDLHKKKVSIGNQEMKALLDWLASLKDDSATGG